MDAKANAQQQEARTSETANEEASATVQVAVLLFASAREAAGAAEARVAVAHPATAGDVMAALVSRFPRLADHRASIRLAVNGEYVVAAHPVKGGDELALIPPTCGG